MAEQYCVGELPYEVGVTHPLHWDRLPDDWIADVLTAHIEYGNGLVGDVVRYMAFEPEPGRSIPITYDAVGEIVVRDIRGVDLGSSQMSPKVGNAVGRFGYYTAILREASGEAPRVPSYTEASKRAEGFAWGYSEGWEDGRPTQTRLDP